MIDLVLHLCATSVNGDSISQRLNLSLTKDYKVFKRNLDKWSFKKAYDIYIYKFSFEGFIFRLECEKHGSHLYFKDAYVYMIDELTGLVMPEPKVSSYDILIYDYHRYVNIPIVRKNNLSSMRDYQYRRIA